MRPTSFGHCLPVVSAVLLLLLLTLAVPVAVTEAHEGEETHPLALINVENIKVEPLNGASIKIAASVLKGAGMMVDVVWSGVPLGTDHWIGVYNPRPKDLTKATPTKWKNLHKKAASGKSKFWFLNQRTPVMVAYFTGGHAHPVLIAESAEVAFEDYNIPMHPHLSFTNNVTQMRVTWVSNLNGSAGPQVVWGRGPHAMTNRAAATTTTYDESMMCGPPAKTVGYRAPGNIHSAVMTGLTPNTLYYYQLGDQAARGEIIPFWSAPKPGSDVDFFVFGDLGQAESDGSLEQGQMPTTHLTNSAMQHDINTGVVAPSRGAAVWHIGDISYARGYATMWEQFHWQIHNISQSTPWMTGDGNHERDYPDSGSVYTGHDSGGECGVPYNHRWNFAMPHPTPSKLDETWWSVNYGPIHWITMSTEHAFKKGSAQHNWIMEDLKKVDRKITPFIIFSGHRPMYCMTMMGPITTALRDAFEPLFVQYQVDVAFWGHIHAYQRTCPLHNLKCVDEKTGAGTIHIISGAPGAGMSAMDLKKKPAWVDYIENTHHGLVRGHVRGNQMELQFVYNNAPGTVVDSVTITSKFNKMGELLPQYRDAPPVEEAAVTIAEA